MTQRAWIQSMGAAACLLVLPSCGPDTQGGAGNGAAPDAASSQPPGSPPPNPGAHETCDGYDNNGDGRVDEGCPCSTGQTQACYPGSPGQDGVGICRRGTQSCVGSDGELATWGPCTGAVMPRPEVCGDGVDDDCDGSDLPCAPPPPDGGAPSPDAGTTVDVPLYLFGDCITVNCPANAPYPVGCQVFFTPGDPRGCIASTPTSSTVYFQAGDQCDQGFITGTLHCSTVPGAPLDAASCPINKPVPIYATSPSGCPTPI